MKRLIFQVSVKPELTNRRPSNYYKRALQHETHTQLLVEGQLEAAREVTEEMEVMVVVKGGGVGGIVIR